MNIDCTFILHNNNRTSYFHLYTLHIVCYELNTILFKKKNELICRVSINIPIFYHYFIQFDNLMLQKV